MLQVTKYKSINFQDANCSVPSCELQEHGIGNADGIEVTVLNSKVANHFTQLFGGRRSMWRRRSIDGMQSAFTRSLQGLSSQASKTGTAFMRHKAQPQLPVGKRPPRLSITHIVSDKEDAKVDIGEARQASAYNQVAWTRNRLTK
jgi:hypothetical protein